MTTQGHENGFAGAMVRPIEARPAPRVDMSMSPTISKIAEALAKAQLQMGPAVKDRKNPHFQNTYATLASCFEALAPLHANGIAVTQIPLDGGERGVRVATVLMHSSGEWIRGDLWMPVSKQDAQGFGSALTYARRYGLQAVTGLAADDDDGNQASPPPPRRQQAAPPRPANTPHVDALLARVREANTAAALNKVARDTVNAGLPAGDVEAVKLAVQLRRSTLQAPPPPPSSGTAVAQSEAAGAEADAMASDVE